MTKLSKLYENKYFRFFAALILIAIPVVLWILPAGFFDHGTSVSVFAWFGVEEYIYSTGMTRGVMHLMHFDFQTALNYNKLSVVVLPLLFLLWLKLLLRQFGIVILKWF